MTRQSGRRVDRKETESKWEGGSGRERVKNGDGRMTEIALEGWVQTICERSHLHLSFHLFKDGHMSCEIDGEASVNKCNNYHVISPCFNGLSGVTHLSVTICDGRCVRLCVYTCVHV